MRKFTAAMLVILLFTLSSCGNEIDVVGETKTYEIPSGIHSLEIQIGAADFTIEHGNKFFVESNLINLSVSEKNGVLSVMEDEPGISGIHSTDYTDAKLKLCIPAGIVFESVDITTGAARLTADSLSANSVALKLGAGNVQFGCLNAYSKADITGGAGEITIASGTLTDLDLSVGVGELNLNAALLGNNELEFGVGKSKLTLIGSKDDYRLDLAEGIGSITVDGMEASDFDTSGYGQNYVKIHGGIGTVDIAFQVEPFI